MAFKPFHFFYFLKRIVWHWDTVRVEPFSFSLFLIQHGRLLVVNYHILGYEHMSATMLRRSASQPFQSGQRPLPRSVGNTPPLPIKHTLTSHYMPLQAYEDYHHHPQQQPPPLQQPHQVRLPSNSSAAMYSNRTEFVLTPRQAQQLQQSLVNRYATIGRNYHINASVNDHRTHHEAVIHHHQPWVNYIPIVTREQIREKSLKWITWLFHFTSTLIRNCKHWNCIADYNAFNGFLKVYGEAYLLT